MLLELIVLLIIGIIFLIVGWSIWKREKINLIHDYHYKNVAEADKRVYCAYGKRCNHNWNRNHSYRNY